MLVIRDYTWFAFIDEPDNNYEQNVTIYDIDVSYKGITSKGFEFKYMIDGYSDIPYFKAEDLLRTKKYRSMDGITLLMRVYKTVYLSQNEMEEMYKDPCGFYRKYIKDSSTCYVQTIINGGAGSEHI